MAMIELQGVSKRFGAVQVLKNCSTSIEAGEVVVICGPSGSGKSTLIKCINGLEPIDQGTILFGGISVHDRSTRLPAIRSKIGMLFQSFELYPHMTLIDNVSLAQRKVLKRSYAEADSRSRVLLDRVGLGDHLHRYPAQLSGGQQQRGAIARSLAMDPVAMLFDEPTSALDPEMIQDVLDAMVALARDGMTMIVVTHEMGFARAVADRVVFMDNGEIVHDGLTESFFGDPPSKRARTFLSKILKH